MASPKIVIFGVQPAIRRGLFCRFDRTLAQRIGLRAVAFVNAGLLVKRDAGDIAVAGQIDGYESADLVDIDARWRTRLQEGPNLTGQCGRNRPAHFCA